MPERMNPRRLDDQERQRRLERKGSRYDRDIFSTDRFGDSFDRHRYPSSPSSRGYYNEYERDDFYDFDANLENLDWMEDRGGSYGQTEDEAVYGRRFHPTGQYVENWREQGPYAHLGLRGRGRPARDYPYGEEEDWRNPGPFTGKGPRGYRRSDERIKEDVSERLSRHGQIDATDIDVEVHNGEVTLTGTVGSRRVKRLAEDVIESIPGVQDVHNHLRLQENPQGLSMTPSWRKGTGAGRVMEGQIIPGMPVVGTNGERVGQVKEVRGDEILVDRPLAKDIYVPLSACRHVYERVTLNITADEIDHMDWRTA